MSTAPPIFTDPGRTARLSDDGIYRYELGRRWSPGPMVCFVMLNPSTADALNDDPTIRRCRAFARSWEMGALTVVNLYALRSPYPDVLARADDPVGPENDDAIHDAVARSRVVVVAWGASPYARVRPERSRDVLEVISGHLGRTPLCLGLTRDGSPRHPVRLPAATRLVPFNGDAAP